MKKNVGAVDRMVRVFLALLIGALIFAGILNGTLAVISGIVAIIMLFTVVSGFCGIYALLGISTTCDHK